MRILVVFSKASRLGLCIGKITLDDGAQVWAAELKRADAIAEELG